MKFLFATLLAVAGAACAPQRPIAPPAVAAAPISKPALPSSDPYAVRKQTSAEKRRAVAAEDAYSAALLYSIAEMDDRTTSPEIIAKAAIAANRDLLEEKIRAQTAHIAAVPWIGNDLVQKKINELPDADDIDFATYMTLRVRKEKLRANPDRSKYEAYLARLKTEVRHPPEATNR